MNLTALRYFVTTADMGSMTSAAQKLQVSQPALSAGIAKLEKHLAVKLFERHGHGVSPSEQGRQLLPGARAALAAVDRIDADARVLSRSEGGSVSVVTPTGVGVSLVSPLAGAFSRLHPDGRLDVNRTYSLDDTVDALRSGDAEVAFLPRLEVPGDLSGFDVGAYELGLAFPPGVRPPSAGVTPKDLDGLPFIASRPGTAADRVLQEARRQGARPRIVMTEPDIAALPHLVSLGVGAAVITTGQLRELTAFQVEVRPFKPRERWPVRLWHRPGELTPMTERFVAVARRRTQHRALT